jgi:hypothetical protein
LLVTLFPLFAFNGSKHTINPPTKHTWRNTKCPPPHKPHVEPPVKNSKITKPNSPNNILFVKQRKSLRFPQKQEPHLVTLIPVCLREHPFFELSPKNPNFHSNLSNCHSKAQNPAYLVVPIKGPPADF